MAASYTTNQRQLYILPTKPGWIFTLLVFVLFLTSIKFSHQPTFLLTFLLASIGIVSSLHTHKNINQLKIDIKHSPAIFAGEYTQFPASIHNTSDTVRRNVWFISDAFHQCFYLDANSSTDLKIKLQVAKRGRYQLPPFSLSSHFPMGVLFSWSRPQTVNAECLVYPKPLDLLQRPDLSFTASDEASNETNPTISQYGNEHISSLKPYQAGDRLRDIHWPALAKTNQLVSKEYESDSEQRLVFSWEHVANLDTEDKLSQLTYWLLEADKQGLKYKLSIPGFESPFESNLTAGSSHLTTCLEQLALW